MSKDTPDQTVKFQALFEKYLKTYCTKRDLATLQEMVTDNFSGFGRGGDEAYYHADGGLAIFDRDIAQAPNPLHYTLHRQEIRLLDPHNALALAEMDLATKIEGQHIKWNNLRMTMAMHEQGGTAKIAGIHISFPTEVHEKGESFPLKELEDRAQLLNRVVREKPKSIQEADEQYQKRLAYEKVVSQISSWAATAEDLDRFQENCLEIMGRGLDISRVYLFRHCPESDTLNNTFEWVAPGVPPEKDNLQGIPVGSLPWWSGTLKCGETIRFSDIVNIPDKKAQDTLRRQGILSVLAVPVFAGKCYHGFLGFDECRKRREWSDDDADMIATISRTIGGVIERKQTEKARQESEKRY